MAAHHLPGRHAVQEWAIAANKNKQSHVLPERYQRHAEIFSEEVAHRFPPERPDDLVIKLKPGTLDTINCKIYPLSRVELDEWHKFVEKNKALVRITDAKSPWVAPIFFIHKKDGLLCLVQDYREVNKWTERDQYPMPRIERILEQLHGKTLFTALDIRDGYNNIHVQPEVLNWAVMGTAWDCHMHYCTDISLDLPRLDNSLSSNQRQCYITCSTLIYARKLVHLLLISYVMQVRIPSADSTVILCI